MERRPIEYWVKQQQPESSSHEVNVLQKVEGLEDWMVGEVLILILS